MLANVGSELSIAFLEVYPIILAAMLWGNSWKRKRIRFHCDNLVVAHILNDGRSPCTAIIQLIRRLVIEAAINNFIFSSPCTRLCKLYP